jgi:hypothetical protein
MERYQEVTMAERDVRERDILVAPNEYAYVQDLTKGAIVLYVGPTKISLSNTERMITLKGGNFVPVRGDEAGLGVHRWVSASSSQYVILENPPHDPGATPLVGANSAVPLRHGRKIVVPGPAQFPLWPGQRAEVVDGHELRQDEYLIVRVYDALEGQTHVPPIGTELVIRGTERSFYLPESGLEVVPERGRYVRKAVRLEKTMGLHLRVIADFEIADDDLIPAGRYRAGEEIFIRDREGYFFPLSNLEAVGLVSRIPLAEKEGIYVRRLASGEITTVHGPVSYLPDPTQEEVVHRPLGAADLALYRLGDHRPDRAVAVYVPPSTAVMVIAKAGRQVVVGPQTHLLDCDHDLERLRLSTGRPKSDAELLTTCFLQIEGNKVSDLVAVVTADHVALQIALSYRVSFVGDSARWFAVEDYVGLLCDHLGSIIRAAARATPIERFHADGAGILRGAVLGPRGEDGRREGRHFEENGMWVYDLEVLDVRILDEEVEGLLAAAQRTAIASEIGRKEQQLRLGDEQLREAVDQQIAAARIETLIRQAELETADRAARLAAAETEIELARRRTVSAAEHRAEAAAAIARAELEVAEGRAALEAGALEARAAAFVRQMEALQPELIATLKTLGGQKLAGELSRNLSPLAILGGDSVADVAERLLARLPLGAAAVPSLSTLLAGSEPEPGAD